MFPFPYLHTWLKQEAPPGQAPQSTWTPKLLPEPHCHSLPQLICVGAPVVVTDLAGSARAVRQAGVASFVRGAKPVAAQRDALAPDAALTAAASGRAGSAGPVGQTGDCALAVALPPGRLQVIDPENTVANAPSWRPIKKRWASTAPGGRR